MLDYKTAGVDIEAGYKSVELMKKHVKETMRPEVLGGLGGFAGAFDLSGIKNMEEPVLLSGTDGCGTKVKLAFVMDKHDTIGIDAVAMCVNDIACSGGEPLFFLDYIARKLFYPGEGTQPQAKAHLQSWTKEELLKISGIGRVKAIQILCLCELSKRMSQLSAREDLDFSRPDTIAAYYMEDMRYYRQEHLKLLMLNTRSRLIGESEISRGTVNMSVISPRELFIEALQRNAVYIILLHNHPSGDPMPSREDILVTQRIREGGSLLGIELLDHIIIGDNCYVSLAEQKLLKEK